MKRSPLSYVTLFVLILSGWQAATALATTPAFNASLQIEGAGGQRFVGYVPAMYDQAAYARWVASGWLAKSATAEASGDTASATEALERTRDIATGALRHAPGDPTLWMHLAKAEAALGEPAAALDAMERARELTPHSLSQAEGRLVFLIMFLQDPEAREIALVDLDLDMVDADIEVLLRPKTHQQVAALIEEGLVASGLKLSPRQRP